MHLRYSFDLVEPTPLTSNYLQEALVETIPNLCQRSQHLVVRCLGLVVRVEQQWVARRPPRVAITDSPNSDTHAIRLVQAGLDNIGPVRSRCILDIDLGESTLGSSGAKCRHGGWSIGTLTRCQVTLRADAVDGNPLGDPLLDVAGHALRLCV